MSPVPSVCTSPALGWFPWCSLWKMQGCWYRSFLGLTHLSLPDSQRKWSESWPPLSFLLFAVVGIKLSMPGQRSSPRMSSPKQKLIRYDFLWIKFSSVFQEEIQIPYLGEVETVLLLFVLFRFFLLPYHFVFLAYTFPYSKVGVAI